MNLFEIDARLTACIKLDSGDFVDTETGEIVDTEAIEKLEMDRAEKLRNIGCWIKNLKSDIDALKAQEKAFVDRRKSAESKVKSLTDYVSAYLNGTAWKCTECEFRWRTSESVVFNGDIKKVPVEYLRCKEPELDKTKIKKALKEGIEIIGCSLEKKASVSVK